MLTRRQFKKISFLSLLAGLKSCYGLDSIEPRRALSTEKSDLFILWERGYLPEENQGILQIVEDWQQVSHKKVNLKLVADEFIEQSLLAVLNNTGGTHTPDIVFSITFNQIIAPLLAWHNRLLDLSSLIKPIAANFFVDVLPQVRYYNQVHHESSDYALPIGQSDAYIHYWKDLLAEIDYTESDIPQEWDQFWQFWQTAQARLRSHQHADLYGLGLCMSANGFDTSAAFQLFLDAHDVAIATEPDGLVLDRPQNRQRLIAAISEFVTFYQRGYVPSDALEWEGSGNNVAFLNRKILMTLNMTLSIPGSQKLENNPYNQNAAQRYQNIGTLATYPKKPDGTLLQAPRAINQILAPQHPRQSQLTLDFLQYLLKPENLRKLMYGFNGRILPTMTQLLNDPLWQNLSTPNSSTPLATVERSRRYEDNKLQLILSQIYRQQLWAQTIHRIIRENISPIQAVDWCISQIQNSWREFENRL